LSAYRGIRLSLFGIMVSVNDAHLWLRTSTDGSTYDSGAANYDWGQSGGGNGGSAFGTGSTGDTKIDLTGNINSSANQSSSGFVTLFEFNQPKWMAVSGTILQPYSATNLNTNNVAGRRLSTTARTALQILPSSGNISGHIVVEGILG
jgi:hypothetical protein